MKKSLYLLLVVAGLAAFAAGCGKATNTNDANENAIINEGLDLNEALDLNVTPVDDLNTNTAIDENTNTSEDLNTNTAAVTNTNTSTTTDETPDTSTSSDTIKITAPEADAELGSSFYVEGTASSGDAVYVRLKASGATVFTDVKVSVRNGAFRGKLLIEMSHSRSGSIEVYQKDSAGNETGLASVPVTFTLQTTNTNTSADSDTNTETNTNS